MAKDKKLVEAITAMEDDFAQWYTYRGSKTELVDYSSVRERMIHVRMDMRSGEYPESFRMPNFKETGVGECCNANVYSRKLFKERRRPC